MSHRITDAIVILGFGILGYVHEFVISDKPELFPTILFGLMLARGITKIFEKSPAKNKTEEL